MSATRPSNVIDPAKATAVFEHPLQPTPGRPGPCRPRSTTASTSARRAEKVPRRRGKQRVDFRACLARPAEPCLPHRDDKLVGTLSASIGAVTGRTPVLSTSGGTSDARFIKDFCPVVEFGLVGKTMHMVDERVALSDLETLTRIYQRFLQDWFG